MLRELYKKYLNKSWKSWNLVFLAVIFFGAVISINLTSREIVLQSDASEYVKLASQITAQNLSLINILTFSSFIDVGYPFFLSLMMRYLTNNIIIYQLFNYAFWFVATVFVYKTLLLLTNYKRAFWGSFIMACSPIFLTFSAKLYSEPFAAMGVAIIIYFLVQYKINRRYYTLMGVVLGMIIFFFTKSVYFLLIVPITALVISRRNFYEISILVISSLLLITRFYTSFIGGRSDYNLAIQSSKLRQSYVMLSACSFYYLSYPVGEFVFPEYEGVCIQKPPAPNNSLYFLNPYVIASRTEGFGINDWFRLVLSNPVKYFVVVLSSMFSLVFIEGVYSNITNNFNSLIALIFLGVVKVLFAYYIWSRVFVNFMSFSKKSWKVALLSIFPLLYFFVIVGNFPVEQRYFYPLMPWLYFYAALDKKGVEKLWGIMT